MDKDKIVFYTTLELQPVTPGIRKVPLKGNITKRGALVFTSRILEELDIDTTRPVKVGHITGVRQIDVIYIVPVQQPDLQTILFSRVARAYGLLIPGILQQIIPDYQTKPYYFTIELITYEGSAAYKVGFKPGIVSL